MGLENSYSGLLPQKNAWLDLPLPFPQLISYEMGKHVSVIIVFLSWFLVLLEQSLQVRELTKLLLRLVF